MGKGHVFIFFSPHSIEFNRMRRKEDEPIKICHNACNKILLLHGDRGICSALGYY